MHVQLTKYLFERVRHFVLFIFANIFTEYEISCCINEESIDIIFVYTCDEVKCFDKCFFISSATCE